MVLITAPIHTPGYIHTWTFDQRVRWVNSDGVEVAIANIDKGYALNIMLFLLRSAKRFRKAYYLQHPSQPRVARGPQGDFTWMENRPLFEALRERVLSV